MAGTSDDQARSTVEPDGAMEGDGSTMYMALVGRRPLHGGCGGRPNLIWQAGMRRTRPVPVQPRQARLVCLVRLNVLCTMYTALYGAPYVVLLGTAGGGLVGWVGLWEPLFLLEAVAMGN